MTFEVADTVNALRAIEQTGFRLTTSAAARVGREFVG